VQNNGKRFKRGSLISIKAFDPMAYDIVE